MPLQLQTAKANGKDVILATSASQDVMEPLTLCRFLKQHFPAEFRQVQYEIIQPANGAKFELPEDVNA
jgi:hypothetical protein